MRDPGAGSDLPLLASGRGGSLSVERLDVADPALPVLPEGTRVLVNNAGVETAYLPLELSSLDAWRQVFETNLFGLVRVTMAAIPLIREAGGGVVCNVTSSSILAPVPFYSVYRASKAAVSALGESLRAEVAAFGIRVVEIMPGPIGTDMYAASERPPEAGESPLYRDLAARMAQLREPVGRMVTPPAEAAARIADAILEDDGPLRYGCDPLSVGMLDAWRGQSDEQAMAGMLAALRPPGA
jgi:NAD(P)-dependent dehydrogenase (short-subunit alcohol dehydrogenase family)